MDLSKVACVLAGESEWIKSPADGVSRIPLEREAAESGHTTSFVKFEAGSFFPEHTHCQGEEIYVLEGVFSDEHGDYPAGTYLRNPPGSRHKPFTKEGCTLFVKLEQFQADDNKLVVLRPEQQQWQQGIGNLKVTSLHAHKTESTALVHWPANEIFQKQRKSWQFNGMLRRYRCRQSNPKACPEICQRVACCRGCGFHLQKRGTPGDTRGKKDGECTPPPG